jgi:hypothetical protein
LFVCFGDGEEVGADTVEGMLLVSEDLNDFARLVSISKLKMKRALVWSFSGGNVPIG